ncbi:MAG TPA: hypothetical protein EYG46_10315 [Myxococcales bacterium]|nr:hypothetical protein [Myxococcales bacterium]
MEKIVYLVWKPADISDVDFRDQLTGETAKQILASGAHKLSVLCPDETTEALAPASITQVDSPYCGMVSAWVDLADDRAPIERAIARVTEKMAGYLVVESVPTVNTTHTAPEGERTPGTTLLTCLTPLPDMTISAFFKHWFEVQRRVATETQCTYLYIRNVVVQKLTADAPDYVGIVEEGFPTPAVTDPMLWYNANGSEEKMKENLGKMMESVQAFLDLSKIESRPTSEYIIKG